MGMDQVRRCLARSRFCESSAKCAAASGISRASLAARILSIRGRKVSLILSILRSFEGSPMASPWDTEDSIREELFSVERLEQHARSLADAQPITAKPIPRRRLAARLKDNEAVLLDAYGEIAAAVRDGQATTPAAEWLLDNYHIVEEQIREAARRSAARAITGSCRSWPADRSPDIRACSASPGPSSPIPTAASIPRCCAGSCAPISGCSRSRSASYGRSRSRCASCWWRIFGALAQADRQQPRSAARSGRPGRPAAWAWTDSPPNRPPCSCDL